MELNEAREKLAKIKNNLAQKEGEKTAVMADLKKEFKIESLDSAYDQFDSLKEQIASQKEKKNTLMASVEERLKQYGV